MNIESEILKNRPNIKSNSLKAYLIILRKLNDNKEIENLDYLKEKEDIMKMINDKALTTQRNYLGSILVALPILKNSKDLLEFYKMELEKVNKDYQDIISSHEKSEKQKTNWSTLDELKEIFNKYKKQINKNNFKSKDTLNSKDFNFLSNYVIVALYTLIPPTRLDYAPMKIIKNEKEDDNKGNYLVNKSRNQKHFIISEYKSSKTYGKQIIKIPSELNSIINLYLKFHKDTDSFLLNSRGQHLTANGLSKLLTSSFSRFSNNKKITLNLLRHIVISENVKLTKDTAESKLANAMQHSEATQQTYIKVD